uniref:Uncharacterized protein n=1 Tax=Fagus sylvatica TaxID=28930 RepID=A0A2N9G520_FAGSY
MNHQTTLPESEKATGAAMCFENPLITVGELNGDSHGGEDVDSLKGKRGVDVVEEEGETLAEAGGGRRDDKNGGDPNCGRFLPSLIDFLTCP